MPTSSVCQSQWDQLSVRYGASLYPSNQPRNLEQWEDQILATGRKGTFVTRDEATKGADLTKDIGLTVATSVPIPSITPARGLTTVYRVKQFENAAQEAVALTKGPTLLEKKAATILENAQKGKAFEQETKAILQATDKGVVEQVTIKTESGTKTKIDLVSQDAQTAKIKLTEAKSSETAPLTPNQAKAFPEIEKSGGTVVGKGKPGVPGGTQIPPTSVIIVRP